MGIGLPPLSALIRCVRGVVWPPSCSTSLRGTLCDIRKSIADELDQSNHTHTHTHTHRERERERERGVPMIACLCLCVPVADEGLDECHVGLVVARVDTVALKVGQTVTHTLTHLHPSHTHTSIQPSSTGRTQCMSFSAYLDVGPGPVDARRGLGRVAAHPLLLHQPHYRTATRRLNR